jgi:hypothetical protein
MPRSQNVAFVGEAPPHREFADPPGEGLAYEVRDALSRAGVAVSGPENWRDSGWSLVCDASRGEVQIAVAAAVRNGAWMLQVAPVRVRGLVDWILRRSVPNLSQECLQLSRTIDAMLKSSGRYSRIMWRADGFPDEAHSSSEPVEVER